MSSYHGWTHRTKAQGGTDPIPGMAAAASMWPMTQELLNPIHHDAIGYDILGSGIAASYPTAATTPPFGWYIEVNSNGATIDVYAKLGPKGSLWAPVYSPRRSNDAGKFAITLQNVGEVATLAESGMFDLDDPVGVIPALSSFTTPPTLYYPEEAAANAWSQDLYTAAAATYDAQLREWVRFMGDDGAPITANASRSTDGHFEFDGGAGVYAIRITCTGKHASSSDFRMRFGHFSMVRMTDQPLAAA